jgi:hypothetical protein
MVLDGFAETAEIWGWALPTLNLAPGVGWWKYRNHRGLNKAASSIRQADGTELLTGKVWEAEAGKNLMPIVASRLGEGIWRVGGH